MVTARSFLVAARMALPSFLQAQSGPTNDGAYELDADASGNLYVTGAFEQTAVFATNQLVSAGLNDLFLARFGDVTDVGEPVTGPVVTLFPNPAGSMFSVSGLPRPATCRVHAMDGSVVLETTVTPFSPCVILPVECAGAVLARLFDGSWSINQVLVTKPDCRLKFRVPS